MAGLWFDLMCLLDWHSWRPMGRMEGYPAGSSKVCRHCRVGDMDFFC